MRAIKIKPEERAYLKGFNSGIHGRTSEGCPYQTNKKARGEWMAGFRDGREQFVTNKRIISLRRIRTSGVG